MRKELAAAIRALLKQRVLLARADRMAASGYMAARIAHRLRSPLSAALVALTNLRDEAVSPDHRQRLQVVIHALQHGLVELRAILEEARPEPEPERPHRLVLHRLVDELFLMLDPGGTNGGLVLDNGVPADMVCRLPEMGTRHALMNLLTNAMEAQQSSAEGFIRVSAHQRDGRIRISVLDRGPGFPESELDRVRSGIPGWGRRDSGVGLVIVRRFVDHLEGRLVLENPAGGGARVILIIPQETSNG